MNYLHSIPTKPIALAHGAVTTVQVVQVTRELASSPHFGDPFLIGLATIAIFGALAIATTARSPVGLMKNFGLINAFCWALATIA